MLKTLDDVVVVAKSVYGSDPLPREFHFAVAVIEVRKGGAPEKLAQGCGTTSKRLKTFNEAVDPVEAIFKTSLAQSFSQETLAKARQSLGQMLIGGLAERAFEKLYKTALGTTELKLEDKRAERNDTDYRIINGSERPVFRINIKFHGTLFRNARNLVGLDSEDCFALATYKIWQGLKKQEEERLPYIFTIVSVPDLTGEGVGKAIPEELSHLSSLVLSSKMSGKRAVEDRIVQHLIEKPPIPARDMIKGFAAQIESAEWRVLSARKAHKLLVEKLFDRVYAVRVRAFARNYRCAEVDMHFSIAKDLTPLDSFLNILREHGLHGLSVRLERGEV